MKPRLARTAVPLITTIQQLFSEDLARENDFLRQENKILRSKLGRRVPLTGACWFATVYPSGSGWSIQWPSSL